MWGQETEEPTKEKEREEEKLEINAAAEARGVEVMEGIINGTKRQHGDFPGSAVVEKLPANAGDTGSSPGPGRSHMLRSN